MNIICKEDTCWHFQYIMERGKSKYIINVRMGMYDETYKYLGGIVYKVFLSNTLIQTLQSEQERDKFLEILLRLESLGGDLEHILYTMQNINAIEVYEKLIIGIRRKKIIGKLLDEDKLSFKEFVENEKSNVEYTLPKVDEKYLAVLHEGRERKNKEINKWNSH